MLRQTGIDFARSTGVAGRRTRVVLGVFAVALILSGLSSGAAGANPQAPTASSAPTDLRLMEQIARDHIAHGVTVHPDWEGYTSLVDIYTDLSDNNCREQINNRSWGFFFTKPGDTSGRHLVVQFDPSGRVVTAGFYGNHASTEFSAPVMTPEHAVTLASEAGDLPQSCFIEVLPAGTHIGQATTNDTSYAILTLDPKTVEPEALVDTETGNVTKIEGEFARAMTLPRLPAS